jgi:tetratricopeptide (TPR) repeat protein
MKLDRSPSPRLYWLVAGLAACLSLAAALLALLASGPASGVPSPDAGAEMAKRAERIAFFERRLQDDAFDVAALNVLVFEYLARARETGDASDYGRAAAAAARSFETLPDYHPTLVATAAARIAVHDFAGGLGLAERAIAARPGQGAGHALRGDALVALGRYDEAAVSFQEALRLEPGAGVFGRLAHLSFLQGDLTNAQDFWRQAIDAARGASALEEAWARVQLGILHFDRGRLDDAAREASSALRLHPESAPASALRARVLAARGDLEGAIAGYEAVVAKQPLLEYITALAQAYAAAGREYEAARTGALAQAIASLFSAEGVNTDLALALYYADQGRNPGEAVRLARNAYEAAPGIYAAGALAWALLSAGMPEEAAPYASEALRLGTPDASLLYSAGMVQRALGNTAEARRLLERAIDTNPYFSPLEAPRAREALSELKQAGSAR